MKKKKQVGSFVAKDASGKAHTVLIDQEFILEDRDLNAPAEWMPGIRSLKTTAGEHVNGPGKGRYQIVRRNGERVDLTSDDPNAI